MRSRTLLSSRMYIMYTRVCVYIYIYTYIYIKFSFRANDIYHIYANNIYIIYIYFICTEGIKAWSPQVQAFGSLDTPLQRLMMVIRVDKVSSMFN